MRILLFFLTSNPVLDNRWQFLRHTLPYLHNIGIIPNTVKKIIEDLRIDLPDNPEKILIKSDLFKIIYLFLNRINSGRGPYLLKLTKFPIIVVRAAPLAISEIEGKNMLPDLCSL